jgi:hypothetical protein
MVGAFNTYPHGNTLVQARLLGLARAPPTVAAADADLKAALRQAADPYLDGIGLDRLDHVDRGARLTFELTASGEGLLKQVLDELSWLPCPGSRATQPTVEFRTSRLSSDPFEGSTDSSSSMKVRSSRRDRCRDGRSERIKTGTRSYSYRQLTAQLGERRQPVHGSSADPVRVDDRRAS